MPPAVSALASRFYGVDGFRRQSALRAVLIAASHMAALAIMLMTESDPASRMAFVLAWGILNTFFLVMVRRPVIAGLLSLAFVVLLVLLSQLKHSMLFMTVNFVDLMVVDQDTLGFLLTVTPGLWANVVITCLLVAALIGFLWWLDPRRVRRRMSALGCTMCVGGLSLLVFAIPSDPESEFINGQYLSKFARSGVTAIADYVSRGLLESDSGLAEKLKPLVAGNTCSPAQKPPHIVMVFDESSFDITQAPGIKVPVDYRQHFTSFDGKNRSFIVEGVGGPSWFTEYNVLTGLSVRSYGRFADFVTRIAAGRVARGLPWALRRCGYKTYSFYSYLGAFLNARGFQETAGIENFYDAKKLDAHGVEPDSFFYDAAARVVEEEKGKQPLFLYVYTVANHFPWDYRFRPDLMTDWRDLGNTPEVDEYLRRQTLSARNYASFVEKLKRDFPDERFLIVRFGDHQPGFAKHLLDPSLDNSFLARQVAAQDVRLLTTYYAIDTINYQPADLTLARDQLDAPFLPLMVLEAAGVPLDASFAEQKRIMLACRGLFYRCHGGAEARRFNQLLINAGLIKGL
jgi:phosphoglycerol transferase MdoB-like AlkP superfamily enzyme